MKPTEALFTALSLVMIATCIIAIVFSYNQSSEIKNLETRYWKIYEERNIFSTLSMQLQRCLLPFSDNDIVSIKQVEGSNNTSLYKIIHDDGYFLDGCSMTIYDNNIRVDRWYPSVDERNNPWWGGI